MNEKDMLSKILNDVSFDEVRTSEELERMIDEELSKPENEIDFDLVDQLTLRALESKGKRTEHIDTEEKFADFQRKRIKQKKSHWKKWTATAVACLALVFGGNAYTLKAYGENLFSIIVNRTESGFTVSFNGDNNIDSETPDVKDDPYGMIAKCAEYGVYPDTPLYIPDGFELVDFKITERKKRICIKFCYKKDDIQLTFLFEKYNNSDDIPNKSIPSDELNLSEVQVNGTVGIVSKEKNSLNKTTDQYELIYCKDNIIYIISSDGLAYNECDKITESMTSNPFEENEGTVHNDVIINTVLPYLKIWNI